MPTRSTPPAGFERELGPGGLEVRTINPGAHGLLVARAAGDNGNEAPVIEGYSSVFNQSTTIGMYYRYDEVVDPDCWTETIVNDDIRSMFNHDTNQLLGRNTSGSLAHLIDDIGLFFRVNVNEEDVNAMSVHAKVKRGDVTGASVWFRVIQEEWTEPDESNGLERPKRRILKGKLYENGPVVFPAFDQTSVSARSMTLVDVALRAAGIEEDERRAQLASDILADPSQLRSLLESAPQLHAAVCSCETKNAPTAPVEDEGRQGPAGAPASNHLAFARGFAARHGLPLTTTPKEQ